MPANGLRRADGLGRSLVFSTTSARREESFESLPNHPQVIHSYPEANVEISPSIFSRKASSLLMRSPIFSHA